MEESKRFNIIIQELETENRILKEKIIEKEDIVSEKQRIISEKQNIINETIKVNENLKRDNIRLNDEYSNKVKENEILNLELQKILNSRSYKLIKKIRSILGR